MNAEWVLHGDGSFDIKAGGLLLQGAYPWMNSSAVHPLHVKMEKKGSGGTILYTLQESVLYLAFSEDADGLVLKSALTSVGKAPHWIYPVGGARLSGADRWFKQGLGFSGPSGIKPLPASSSPGPFESYLVTALVSTTEETLAIGACDTRNYLQRTTLYGRERKCQFQDRATESFVTLLDCGFATERVVPGKDRLELPDLHFLAGQAAFAVCQKLAKKIASASEARTKQKPSYHWCSWYERTCHFNMDDLNSMLIGLKKIDPPSPIQTLQIDDGYCSSPGDWLLHNSNYPDGLETLFKTIYKNGYRPGIWIAPFMVGRRSGLYRQHPDWVLKGLDGQPIAKWKNYDGSAIASHNDEETYILDTTNPEAFDFLRNVFRTMFKWGARFFKTDFMDWGMQDSTTVKRAVPGKTSVQVFTDVLRMVRQEIGEESYWLACISPFPPFIGFADGARVATDVGPVWHPNALGNMLEETFADQYFNNIWWQNDPDVLYLRDKFTNLSPRETETLALWDGFFGGVINTSDRIDRVSEECLKLWRFLEPIDKPVTAVFPCWSKQKKLIIGMREYPDLRAWAVLVLNPTGENMTEVLPLSELIGRKDAFLYSWRPGKSTPLGKQENLVVTPDSHEALLFYLGTEEQPPSTKLGLSGLPVKGLG